MRHAGARVLAGLDAGAFAFVMATGIVSIAAALQGLPTLSRAFLGIGCAAALVLGAAVGLRALRTSDPRPRLRSFAVVAGTAVLGSRFALAGRTTLALALWSLACVLWLALLLRLRRPARGDLGGGALLVVVATESLAVLAAVLAPAVAPGLLPVALACWSAGLLLYPAVAGAVSLRFRRAGGFAPDLWIVMGALAIATLAGSELLLSVRALHELHGLGRWLPDADLATWALASALVPLLVAAELHARDRWRAEAGRWSFVFPLGMYAVASRTLARADDLPFLSDVGRAFFVLALAAWAVVLLGVTARTAREAAGAAGVP